MPTFASQVMLADVRFREKQTFRTDAAGRQATKGNGSAYKCTFSASAPPLPEKPKPALAPGFSCHDTSPNTLFRIAGGAKNQGHTTKRTFSASRIRSVKLVIRHFDSSSITYLRYQRQSRTRRKIRVRRKSGVFSRAMHVRSLRKRMRTKKLHRATWRR
jgi:hypothetical protein